jgi:hypothetical protein
MCSVLWMMPFKHMDAAASGAGSTFDLMMRGRRFDARLSRVPA